MLKKALLSLALAQGYLCADATLAPSRLEVKDGFNMYVEGQFLWWLSKTDNLYFCQDGTSSASDLYFTGSMKKLNTDFVPGGRLTFGGLMAYDHWDLHFTWTYFTQSASARAKQPAFYVGNTFNQPALASYIKAKYNITLNMLDAVMTRPSWMGERFSLAPYFGARGTWLDQVFKTEADLVAAIDVKNRSRSDFRGAGILAGFNLRYELKGGWSIEGNFLTSGVYGKFVNYFSGYLKDPAQEKFTSADRKIFSRDVLQSMLVDLEFKLGIAYNKFLDNGRYLLGGGIAWEEVIFINGNRLPMWTTPMYQNGSNLPGMVQSNPSNLLTLQGLTLRLVFGF